MSLPNGTYLILNVRQNNSALLPDNNDGTPIVSASPNNADKKQQWIVTAQGNYFTIQNVNANNFANTGTRAQPGSFVEGRRPPQQFDISPTRVSGQYTISTTDTRLFWQLPDNQPGSPLLLTDAATDQRSWWLFNRV
ncbi:hypothetical protein AMATHDRAFT_8702 [Amanita thiersii Skay4041]|uniref:Ricin B lectin domain-containing protein n=1 Tax=Amanita thiersii Skay4041 TaxID=703135 RepID=A0A2A9N742_9AGAR|nr:hypothetical protein AMATHDRAFT_8702 [Amanita thiersii Skay4041]